MSTTACLISQTNNVANDHMIWGFHKDLGLCGYTSIKIIVYLNVDQNWTDKKLRKHSITSRLTLLIIFDDRYMCAYVYSS